MQPGTHFALNEHEPEHAESNAYNILLFSTGKQPKKSSKSLENRRFYCAMRRILPEHVQVAGFGNLSQILGVTSKRKART